MGFDVEKKSFHLLFVFIQNSVLAFREKFEWSQISSKAELLERISKLENFLGVSLLHYLLINGRRDLIPLGIDMMGWLDPLHTRDRLLSRMSPDKLTLLALATKMGSKASIVAILEKQLYIEHHLILEGCDTESYSSYGNNNSPLVLAVPNREIFMGYHLALQEQLGPFYLDKFPKLVGLLISACIVKKEYNALVDILLAISPKNRLFIFRLFIIPEAEDIFIQKCYERSAFELLISIFKVFSSEKRNGLLLNLSNPQQSLLVKAIQEEKTALFLGCHALLQNDKEYYLDGDEDFARNLLAVVCLYQETQVLRAILDAISPAKRKDFLTDPSGDNNFYQLMKRKLANAERAMKIQNRPLSPIIMQIKEMIQVMEEKVPDLREGESLNLLKSDAKAMAEFGLLSHQSNRSPTSVTEELNRHSFQMVG